MASATLEERVTALEARFEQLKEQQVHVSAQIPCPWWDAIFGTFADSPNFDDATRLGREYRESLWPKDDEGTD